MPALPLDEAGKYVAGAYVVFLALVLLYVAIMATRLARIERELGELEDAVRSRDEGGGRDAPPPREGEPLPPAGQAVPR